MTTPTPSANRSNPDLVDEMATYLGPGCFPATHDHLAATLIRRHAPSHLLWHLSTLPRSREFECLDELVAQLEQTATPSPLGTVGDPS